MYIKGGYCQKVMLACCLITSDENYRCSYLLKIRFWKLNVPCEITYLTNDVLTTHCKRPFPVISWSYGNALGCLQVCIYILARKRQQAGRYSVFFQYHRHRHRQRANIVLIDGVLHYLSDDHLNLILTFVNYMNV